MKDAGVAAGSAEAGSYRGTGQETQLHQAAGIVARKIDRIEHRGIAAAEVDKRRFEIFCGSAVATQLHLSFSMRKSEIVVNSPALIPTFFRPQWFRIASKWSKIKDNRMNAPLSVRLFRVRDLEEILRIEHASFRSEAYDRKLFADLHRKCGGLFLVAETPGRICGYMVTCFRPETGRAEIVSLAVEPKARRKGAASLLMQSTLRRLKRRGANRVGLMVKERNRGARRFYEKYGFLRVRRVPKYYDDGSDGVFMRREV